MNIQPQDLLPNETLLLSKNANAIIKIDEHGLSRFAADQFMWAVGMQGKEAIGGRLHLTNHRLIFKSHVINRLKGKFSILLPTIKSVRDTSFLITRRVEITTGSQTFEFVVWGIPALMDGISQAQAKLDQDKLNDLRSAVLPNYQKLGEGLEIFKAIEAINRAVVGQKQLSDIVPKAQNQIELAGILNMLELFDE